MSRKLALIGLALAAFPTFASADTEALISYYEKITRVTVRSCAAPQNNREILVCARRTADRYRVPFVGYDIGDPRAESVSGERNRLASTPRVPCGQGAIIANCGGGVGVSAGIKFGVSGLGAVRLRPLSAGTD